MESIASFMRGFEWFDWSNCLSDVSCKIQNQLACFPYRLWNDFGVMFAGNLELTKQSKAFSHLPSNRFGCERLPSSLSEMESKRISVSVEWDEMQLKCSWSHSPEENGCVIERRGKFWWVRRHGPVPQSNSEWKWFAKGVNTANQTNNNSDSYHFWKNLERNWHECDWGEDIET